MRSAYLENHPSKIWLFNWLPILTTGIDEKDSNHLSNWVVFFLFAVYKGSWNMVFPFFLLSRHHWYFLRLFLSPIFLLPTPTTISASFCPFFFMILPFSILTPLCRINPMSVIIYLDLFVDKQILFCLIYMENKNKKNKHFSVSPIKDLCIFSSHLWTVFDIR